MPEGKHTPGPWLLQDRTVYALNDERIPVNRFTASVDSGWLHDKARVSREEVDANARLIAAAPELLEALESMLEIYDDGVGRDWELQAWKDARAAITKAKGEA